MTDREKELYRALDEARAMFHGFSAAFDLSQDDPDNYILNLKNIAAGLKEGNKKAGDILSKYPDLYHAVKGNNVETKT